MFYLSLTFQGGVAEQVVMIATLPTELTFWAIRALFLGQVICWCSVRVAILLSANVNHFSVTENPFVWSVGIQRPFLQSLPHVLLLRLMKLPRR